MAALSEIREAVRTLVEAEAVGLKVFPTVPASTTNAALVVRPASPAASFNEAYGRGTDRWDFDLIVVIGGGDVGVMQNRLDEYIDGGGSRSIRKLVFNNSTLAGLAITSNVSGVTAYGPRDDAGYEHVSATLRLTVYTKPA